MISVQVTLSDGNIIRTGINATFEEAKEYYLGKQFETTEELTVKAIRVELI